MGQQPYPPPMPPVPPPMPYGVPPMMPGQQLPKGMSVASLVLGIVSLFCAGIVTGILAIVFGAKARGLCNQGRYGGKGMATAGLVMGIIGTVLTSIIWILYFTGAFVAASQSGGY